MDKIRLIKTLLDKSKEIFDDSEVYQVNGKKIDIGIYNGEIDKYSIAESGGLSFRGLNDGKMGYSYMDVLNEEQFNNIIEESYSNSLYLDTSGEESISSGSKEYKDITIFNKNLESIPIEDKIEFARNLEKEAYALDKRVTNVQNCFYNEFHHDRNILNTKGMFLNDRTNGAIGYISVIVKEGEDTKTGSSFKIFSEFNKDGYKEIAAEAVNEAISQLGAKPTKSGKYPVIIRNKQFASLLEGFNDVFSADKAEKRLSLLKDKEGEIIANHIVNIIDDPHSKIGLASRGFDDEGTATKYRKIVENGKLTTLLHNNRTAKKAKKESTGNGTRSSYNSPIGIAPSNLYLEKGSNTFEGLLQGIEYGIYITGVTGLHAGINTISGDFSISANGFEIVNGKVNNPVNQITIAGNFYKLLYDIEAIGDDLMFNFPGNSQYGSSSVRIKELSISGE